MSARPDLDAADRAAVDRILESAPPPEVRAALLADVFAAAEQLDQQKQDTERGVA